MGEAQLKQKLHQFVDTGDSRLLKLMYALAKEYVEEDYTIPGKPMTTLTLKQRIKDAKTRIKNGHFTTQKAIEKEIKEW